VDLKINDKVALVLGGGGGLGSAIAQTLAREGARVAVADVDSSAAAACAQAIVADKRKAMPLTWDINDLSMVDERIKSVEQEFGSVDILVNNTGGPPPTPAAGQDPAVWNKHFGAMVVSVIAITDRVLPGMRSRKWGRIVTSTSSGVVAPIANLGISNALRLSLVGWSKTLAREIARDGVTANIILPGRIGTQRIKFLDEQKAKRENRTVESVSAESTDSIPIGRYGEPQEYANAVAFLASQCASYITGSVVRVDGGLIASI
jgi:3-oxoacyl-[acyl-carrier protein] reductase